MIQVLVKSKKEIISEIIVSGHSNYAQAGSDIVCSAVSTAMYLSLGLIEKLCPNYDFKADEDIPKMELRIFETNANTDLVIKNLVDYLKGISKSYAKYLNVKIENRR